MEGTLLAWLYGEKRGRGARGAAGPRIRLHLDGGALDAG